MNRKVTLTVTLIAAAIIVGSIITYTHPSGPKITVSGAWALYPMMVKWAEEYTKTHPDISIEVSAGGAGKGMTDVLSGLVDIGMVSREIYPEEAAQGAFWVAVVNDAVVSTVSESNPVLQDILTKGVKKVTFMEIFIYKNVTNWGQVVGDPENTDEIHVYVRSDSCGAAETWAAYMGEKQEDLNGTGVYGDPGLAEAVKNDPLGIGFNNVNYAYDSNSGNQIDGLAVVPVDLNEDGVIDASEGFYTTREEIIDAIATGAYPSPPARELNLVGKGNFEGATKDLVKWILTEGQQYALETGYVPLTEERLAEELAKLE